MDADVSSAICTDVIFVSTELTTLCCNALQFLLGWSISITDLHQQALLADCGPMELFDDVLALFAGLEARGRSVASHQPEWAGLD